jgi:hypothetical protein
MLSTIDFLTFSSFARFAASAPAVFLASVAASAIFSNHVRQVFWSFQHVPICFDLDRSLEKSLTVRTRFFFFVDSNGGRIPSLKDRGLATDNGLGPR